MDMLKDKRLWLCILLTLGLGMLSGLFANNAPDYYQSLNRPTFSPPAWVFGPVWTVLYIMIGIALYTILRHDNPIERHRLIHLFTIQFICNLIWTYLFFTLQNMLFSVIDITILWALILALLIGTKSKLPLTFWLLVPYFLWVSFATILNYAIFLSA